ncbi:MAG: hypothetical protein DSY89_04780 [Deltaproteobacteria bacterium]|nr:MAG: hypothetical protein DSY89_04780 [Deltaproteobacteria bacterium]
MIERTAGLKFNARILSRNGKIVWVKDIRGEAKDRVVQDFVKNSTGRRMGVGFWNSLLNSIGKQ